VVSFSVDGFTAGTPTAALRDGRDAMLAIAMNGEPLPVEHGVPGPHGRSGPVRVRVRHEMAGPPRVDDVRRLRRYWIPRGWAQQAPIKTGSRIDRPRGGSRVGRR
jgi:hypothetical protein